MLNQITMISNVCFEPYWRVHIKDSLSYLSHNIKTNYVLYDGFQAHIDDIKNADIIVVSLDFDVLYYNLSNNILSGKVAYEDIRKDCLQKCRKLYSTIKANTKAHIIWFGFEDYFCLQNNICGSITAFDGLVDQLNLTLMNMLKADSFVDLKRLIATVGIMNAYNAKGKYRWNAPYSKDLIRLMADEIHKQLLIFLGITKKCLVLDCDNVLWGGILSEDGIERIQISNIGLGRIFQDFQRYLLDLYYHGVILTVCSRNDKADVLRVFREHTGMLLKEENIACIQCNWENKVDNIKTIADSLNIDLESMVFVDDSIFEIESVRTMLPDVTTVLYQRDSIYQELSCFNLKQNVDLQTIKERTSTYKTNYMRDELKKKVSSYDDYISSLEMVVDIHKTADQELMRVSELTQRTNKCTNGVRYTLDQLKSKINDENYELYTVCLSDRFSDLGVVGTMGISGKDVDLFALSCRALGRTVEDKMISRLLESNAESISFVATNKNDTLLNLFSAYGLRITERLKIKS